MVPFSRTEQCDRQTPLHNGGAAVAAATWRKSPHPSPAAILTLIFCDCSTTVLRSSAARSKLQDTLNSASKRNSDCSLSVFFFTVHDFDSLLLLYRHRRQKMACPFFTGPECRKNFVIFFITKERRIYIFNWLYGLREKKRIDNPSCD
jgi:hypothetical protein